MSTQILSIVPYFITLFLPLGVLLGFGLQGPFVFSGIFVIFGLHLMADFWLGRFSKTEFQSSAEKTPFKKAFQIPLVTYALFQILTVVFLLCGLHKIDLKTWEYIGLMVSTGVMTGSVGMAAAHEFVHRLKAYERGLGIALLGCLNYYQFRIEHVYGHHLNVGLRHDPNTARRGEPIYAYWVRSILMGWRSAWRIEGKRMKQRGRSEFGWHNRMMQYTFIQVLVFSLIYVFLGPETLLFFIGQSFVAILMIELGNYIEHYGLVRSEIAPGIYEPVREEHSWDSTHKITNWFLFDLGKHSHHHKHPAEHYEKLALTRSVRFLPLGYSALAWLSFFPPLFFRVMDRKLKEPLAHPVILKS